VDSIKSQAVLPLFKVAIILHKEVTINSMGHPIQPLVIIMLFGVIKISHGVTTIFLLGIAIKPQVTVTQQEVI
jgi:hypothetical protein